MNLLRSQPLSAADVEELYSFVREERRRLKRPLKSGERSEAVGVLLHAGLNNAVWTVGLALGAAIGSRLWRSRPAVGHALWLLVLLKLVTPSLVRLAMPVAELAVRDLPKPVALLESQRPVAATEPSVDLAPTVAANSPRDAAPAEVSHEGSVAIASEPARPPVAQTSARGIITRSMMISGVGAVWIGGAIVWWSVIGIYSARFRRLMRAARPCRQKRASGSGGLAGRLGLSRVPDASHSPGPRPALGLGAARRPAASGVARGAVGPPEHGAAGCRHGP